MQIQIKQPEIITAIKQYIARQGINLQNKEVAVTFIAGRKGAGISADVVISESSIPGFETDVVEEETANKPSLSVVRSNEKQAEKVEEALAPSTENSEANKPETTEAPAKPVNSLFNQ